jgi:hypothetical protein
MKGEPGEQSDQADRRSLREVRAAQLRAVAIRWAIGKSVLGTIFLLGAIAHALSPEPRASSTSVWMSLLVVLSSAHVGLGLRTFARVRRRAARFWLPATFAWGLLATALVYILSRRGT